MKCLVLNAKTLKFMKLFTARSCDTTHFLRFFCSCDAISSHFTIFLGSKYRKLQGVFTFKTSQILKSIFNTQKTFLHIFGFINFIPSQIFKDFVTPRKKFLIYCRVWCLFFSISEEKNEYRRYYTASGVSPTYK